MESTINNRRIYNPVQKDAVIFLKTSEETQGELTLVEVELAPHGGNSPHYHTAFSEQFEVLEGELNVQLGKENHVLKAGQKATAQPHVIHRFYSTSDQPTRFQVELRPGSSDFENALRIAYGLADSGETFKDGTPKNLLAFGYVVTLSSTGLPGAWALLTPLFKMLNKIALMRGIDKRLAERYLQPF